MWTVSNCRGPQTIFQERNLFSLSAAEEICGSPLPELETFSKLLCRPCDRRLWNYKWMSPEPKAKQFARISEPQAPFWSMNFLPTPDIISLSCRQNLVEDLPPLRNFLTHISTWPAATRVLSRMKREREPWEQGCLTASYSSFFKNGSTKSTTRSSQRNRRSICAEESWSCCKCTSCTSLSDGCHFLFVNCVLKCRLDHT